ncbi:hypothetical protein M408DRAFT_326263 [Serendipita vermifera MAFF 305830]|uniref:Mini-chromosome maintenance complex-binding protein n=1 Tax=Serendipita vermifera MAFF 305830 TaxID=933852 RepID=A0A0C2X667_SERVB|nr:hypothetical protein M408DRAFT_326263 [Serendipita vermifera MAFF 305830]
MVSTLISDTILDPSKEINALYSSQNPSEFVKLVETHFKQILSPHDAFYQIPPLNASYPPSLHTKRRIARFYGMIQDTSASPEVYLTSLEDKTCGGWGIYENSSSSPEAEHEHGTIDYSKLGERESVWAVTVPGETMWSQERFNGSEFQTRKNPMTATYSCPKQYKNPSADPASFVISLKLYDGGNNLKPGEMGIFVGILDEEVAEIEEGANSDEGVTVPTLHVLFTVPHAPLGTWNMSGLNSTLPGHTAEIRTEIIKWLADEGLGGDTKAATWLLLMILSRVQSRSPPILPLSLAISSFPDAPQGADPTPAIIWLLKEILPTVTVVPLTLDTINGKSFAPHSTDEDLHAGLLQQASGTTAIVTETGIKEGKVTESGLKNLSTLQAAITMQTVDYVFPFSAYSFPIDLSFTVLTRGRKSAFLKTDVVVPLKSTASDESLPKTLYKQKDAVQMPPREKLEAFRDYILAAKKVRVSLAEDVGKHIEDEFVRLRKESSSAPSSEDLARRMAVAKLLSASLLESNMTKETWTEAGVMDQIVDKL